MPSNKLNKAALAALCVAIASGAAHAMPWSWDMFDQISVKAQESAARPVPEGNMATNAEVRVKDKEASAKLKNPVAATPESVERGKFKYAINCGACHGDTGKGDGLVGQKYVGPTDLTGDTVQKDRKDGEIYYVITYGSAIMPAYGDAMTFEDRWHIVNYIRQVFGKKEKGK